MGAGRARLFCTRRRQPPRIGVVPHHLSSAFAMHQHGQLKPGSSPGKSSDFHTRRPHVSTTQYRHHRGQRQPYSRILTIISITAISHQHIIPQPQHLHRHHHQSSCSSWPILDTMTHHHHSRLHHVPDQHRGTHNMCLIIIIAASRKSS